MIASRRFACLVGLEEVDVRCDEVQILSVSHIEAPEILSSEEIEGRLRPLLKRLAIPVGILKKLSGIESRHMFPPSYPPSEGATAAATQAIEAAGIDVADLGMLVNTSVCRDSGELPTASRVHQNLGLSADCLSFDLGNACLAFVNGMETVAGMIERRIIEYGAVVACENTHFAVLETIKRLLDPRASWDSFRDNFATLTLGSGAVAMVLGRSRGDEREHRFLGSVTRAATEYNRLCTAQVDRMLTNTQKLFHHGLELGLKTWDVAREALGWSVSNLDHFIIHQVGKAHTETFARRLGIDLTKIFRLYPDHGNIGPAGVPIVLSRLQQLGKLHHGDRIAVMGIGSGINCSMAEIRW